MYVYVLPWDGYDWPEITWKWEKLLKKIIKNNYPNGYMFQTEKNYKFGVDTFNFTRHIFMWNGGTLTKEKVFLILVSSQNEWLSPTYYSQIFRLKYQLESTFLVSFK